MTKRALISVSDKTGIQEFARSLHELNVEILSTGGTAKTLKDAGIPVIDVSLYTGFPEILNGRVKTLHPKIYGGILAVRDSKKHLQELLEQNIEPIDLVVCNLYPFEEMTEKEIVSEEEATSNIDIGGPTMIRAAAKNYKFVTVVVNPKDYEKVLNEIREHGDTTLEMRQNLARIAYARTFQYDEAIEHYFRKLTGKSELLDLHYEKVFDLRYGENPHQQAAFYRNPLNKDSNVTNAKVLHGKQLSFNNIVDADSAIELVKEFPRPTVCFIKHNNPCGVASADSIEDAFINAHLVDPVSAYGGVIGLNWPVNKAIVDYIQKNKLFIEIIICPKFEADALEELKKKKDIRLLEVGALKLDEVRRDLKKVAGGILVQTKDTYRVTAKDLKVVSAVQPTPEELKSMIFAFNVSKFVRSNAIVFAKNEVVTGIGAGQMSRVDAAWLAAHKAKERATGSVMASDAFLPFPDVVEVAHEAGITGIIQTGGSIRDKEVIAKADELGMNMVFTGIRFFRH